MNAGSMKIPLHYLLDKALGFSLRDLKLDTPEEVEEFRKRIQELLDKLEKEEKDS